MRSLITVIVPVYNKCKYLSLCIESILSQTVNDYNVILVDDGSTDGSSEICDMYEKKDDRILVIHKENEGLVKARETGVINAKTPYVVFVDSDDWVDDDFISCFMSELHKDNCLDLVAGNMTFEKTSGPIEVKGSIRPGVYSLNDIKGFLPKMMYSSEEGNWGIIGSACGKAFLREKLIEHQRSVDRRITYGEDDALVYPYIAGCSRIVILDRISYHYRIHNDSMALSYDGDSYERIRVFKECIEDQFKKMGLWEQQKDGVNQLVMMFLVQLLKKDFGVDIGYQFPFDLIKPQSSIILYGAGVIGKSYYNSLKSTYYVKNVYWVDKDFERIGKEGYNVSSPDIIRDVEYDMILVAIEGRELSLIIKDELIRMGVEPAKIVWTAPRFLQA